jgi:hypothetical protein
LPPQDISGVDGTHLQRIIRHSLAAKVVRWLATDDTFGESDEYDVLRGLALPEEALTKILTENFERFVGAGSAPLDRRLARAECERIAGEIDALGLGEGPNHARLAAERLA